MDFLRSESHRVVGKTEDDKWVSWEHTMPFKVFSGQLPFIARGNLIVNGEREEVGS